MIIPPGNLSSHEPPLESSLHLQQLILLLTSLSWLWQDRTDYFAAGNLTIYYSPNQRKSEDFRGPDFFVVLGTERRPRKSWTLWEEDGKYPNVIVELLSGSTASVDRGLKKEIYQDTFRTLEYFWFDPVSFEFEGFSLVRGRYEPILPNDQGWRWSDQLQLFLGIHDEQLRFFGRMGAWCPRPKKPPKLNSSGPMQNSSGAIALPKNCESWASIQTQYSAAEAPGFSLWLEQPA